jgi:hypothetical protein
MKPGWTPSPTTSAALAGGYIATIIIEALRFYRVPVDASLAGAITGLCCIGLSYLHPQGRLQRPE